MIDLPTPETDAVAEKNIYGVACKVDVDFARKLERERDEAREEVSSIRNMLSRNGEAVGNGEHNFSIIEMVENLLQSKDYFVRKSDSLERERDEAWEKLSARWQSLRDSQDEVLRLTFENRSLSQERDEAREELAILRSNKMSDPLLETTFKHLNHERDELREDANQLADRLTALELHSTSELARLEKERDEARIDAKKSKAYKRVLKEANANLKRERDEAREDAAKWESSSDAMERAGAEQARRADENREWALKAERERDEAREAAYELAKQAERLRKERDQLKEALLIMENLLKPGIELFPEIGEILKQGGAK